MKMTKNEIEFAAYMAMFGIIIVGLIFITCRLTYRTDEADKKLDEISEKVESISVQVEHDHAEETEQNIVLYGIVTNALEERKEVETATATDAKVEELTTEQIQSEVVETSEVELTTQDVGPGTYCGSYELTAYIATGNPCADGVYPQTGYTVACNDRSLWHKWVYIEGYGTYYVHDTGGMANNVIDIFVGSYDEAIQFGRRSANVYIVE